MKIYDCFTFFNESDLLEMRLNILDAHVDYFVIVESTKTHSGIEKELFFVKEAERFKAFSKKIIHVVVEDMPELRDGDRWRLENFQRDAIMRGLSECAGDDVILISDLDEIPNLEHIAAIEESVRKNSLQGDLAYRIYSRVWRAVRNLKSGGVIRKLLSSFPIRSTRMIGFKQKVYYYYLNGFMHAQWIGTRAVLCRDLISRYAASPQRVRESSPKTIISDGGWHFSYLLSPEDIAKKIRSFAHAEFDAQEYTDIAAITRRIAAGEDLFGRNEKIAYVQID